MHHVSFFLSLLLLLTYHSILISSTSHLQNLTPSPLITTKSLCGTQTASATRWCYEVDLYPMPGIEVTDTVLIANSDDINPKWRWSNTYFHINIKSNGNDCINPIIDFIFEEIDFDSQSSEYLQVLRDDGTEIEKCTGSMDNNCGNWISCFINMDLGDVTKINKDNTYTLTIYEPWNVDAVCGPYSIHAIFTIKCAALPTNSIIKHPTNGPTMYPTEIPTNLPSNNPSLSPSKNPTESPSKIPSTSPTTQPSENPTSSPSNNPSISPSNNPSISPSNNPSISPSNNPTVSPSKIHITTVSPINDPMEDATVVTSSTPDTPSSTTNPSVSPTNNPSLFPTNNPSVSPSKNPSTSPSIHPSTSPTNDPSISPTHNPSISTTNNAASARIDDQTGNLFDGGESAQSPSNDLTTKPTLYTLENAVNIYAFPSVSPSINPIQATTKTNGMVEPQILEKENKFRFAFEFKYEKWYLWILILIILPCFCIICCCIFFFFCRKRYGTETTDTMIPMEYDDNEQEEAGYYTDDDDDDDDDEEKADELEVNVLNVKGGNKNKHKMGNKTLMDMIDVINNPNNVILEDEKIDRMYDDDIDMNLQSDHDIAQTMIIKLSPPNSQYSQSIEMVNIHEISNIHYQRHNNMRRTMIIKPSPPSSIYSETANTVHVEADDDIEYIHQLIYNVNDNNEYEMSDTDITETYDSTSTSHSIKL